MILHDQAAIRGAADEVRILDLGAVVLRRWRLVAGLTAAVMLLAAAVALLSPKLYTAQVLMLPPAQGGGGSAGILASQLTGLPGLGGGGDPSQRAIGVIARSRALADSVVARVAPPATEPAAAAAVREMLGRRTKVNQKSDGSISVEVSGKDPRLAAEVANAFPPVINAISARLGAEAAQEKGEFLEAQLDRARERLELSETRLVAFQKGQNAPDIQEQARKTMDAAATLQQQITAQELRVNQLSRSSTSANPALRAAVSDLNALRGQLSRLNAGGGGQMFVAAKDAPDIKAAVTRLTREYAKDERVYLSLTAAVADAQIAANDDVAVVSVLDPAVAPGSPTGFSLPLVLAVAGLLGLVLGLIVAFVVEHLARARQVPEGGSFFEAWEQFKGDLRRGGMRRRSAAGSGMAG
ncbi:MAG: hypothetical protein KY444_00420 [Gemmatimonadetes bacterium]|nr:hypothetical protein [Gemmatimonadota bacterium]